MPADSAGIADPQRFSVLVVQRVDGGDLARPAGGIVSQLLVLGLIELRLLIFGEQSLCLRQGALLHVFRALGLPLLDRVVVEQLGDEEGPLEIGLGMRMSKIVPAGSDIADGRLSLLEVIPSDALGHAISHGAHL